MINDWSDVSVGLVLAVLAAAFATIIYVIPKKDAAGFEVTKGETFYYCTEIKVDAGDHRLAVCITPDECNRICDKQRNVSK